MKTLIPVAENSKVRLWKTDHRKFFHEGSALKLYFTEIPARYFNCRFWDGSIWHSVTSTFFRPSHANKNIHMTLEEAENSLREAGILK